MTTALGGRGPRKRETLCTVCDTLVGVHQRPRPGGHVEYKTSRHNRQLVRENPICTVSGILVAPNEVMDVARSA